MSKQEVAEFIKARGCSARYSGKERKMYVRDYTPAKKKSKKSKVSNAKRVANEALEQFAGQLPFVISWN